MASLRADSDAWKAAASVLQVSELWKALEHFRMQGDFAHRIARGRRSDALQALQQLADTVRVCC
jgi:hypothetical protein